jgi:two-component system, chemotaxis family, CheB/CheR fusion protein
MANSKFEFSTTDTFRASIFDTLGMAVCVTDETGKFVEVNDAYCALYGYERQELIGTHFSIVVPEHYRSEASRIHDAFMAGAPEMPAEWQVVRKDGQLRNIYVVPSMMTREDGMRCKVTSIADITEYKAMQTVLKVHGEKVSA